MRVESSKIKEAKDLIYKLQKFAECSICLDFLTEPVATRCEHVFCRECIQQVIKGSKSPCCPLCKEVVTRRSLNTRSSHEKFVQMVKDVELAFQQDLDGLQQRKTTQNIVKGGLSQSDAVSRKSNKGNNERMTRAQSTSTDFKSNELNQSKSASQDCKVLSKSLSLPGKAMHPRNSISGQSSIPASQNDGSQIRHSKDSNTTNQDNTGFELIKSKRKLTIKSTRLGYCMRNDIPISSSFDDAYASTDNGISSKRSRRNDDNAKLIKKDMQTIDSWLLKDGTNQAPSQSNSKEEIKNIVNNTAEKSPIDKQLTDYSNQDKSNPFDESHIPTADVVAASQTESSKRSKVLRTDHADLRPSSFFIALTNSQKQTNGKLESLKSHSSSNNPSKSDNWVDILKDEVQPTDTHTNVNSQISSKACETDLPSDELHADDKVNLTNQMDLSGLTPELELQLSTPEKQNQHPDTKTFIKSYQNTNNTTPKRFYAGSITRAMHRWKDSSISTTPNAHHTKARLRRLSIRKRNNKLTDRNMKLKKKSSLSIDDPKLSPNKNVDSSIKKKSLIKSTVPEENKTSSTTAMKNANKQLDIRMNLTSTHSKTKHCIPKMGICHSESISSDGDSSARVNDSRLCVADSNGSSSMEIITEHTSQIRNSRIALSPEPLTSDQGLSLRIPMPLDDSEFVTDRSKFSSKRDLPESLIPDRPRKKLETSQVDSEKGESMFKVPHQRIQQTRDQNKITTDYKGSFQKDSEHGAITQHHQCSILRLDHRLSGEKDTDKNLNCESDNQYIENSESMPLFLPNSDVVTSRRNLYSIGSDHTRTQDIKGSAESDDFCSDVASKYQNLIPGSDDVRDAAIFVSSDSALMDYPLNQNHQTKEITKPNLKDLAEKPLNSAPDSAFQPIDSGENDTNLKQSYVIPDSEEFLQQLESSKMHELSTSQESTQNSSFLDFFDDNNPDNPESVDSQVLENIRAKMNKEKERIAKMKALLDAEPNAASSQSPRKSNSSLASDLTCTVMPIGTQPYIINNESDDRSASESDDDTRSLESINSDAYPEVSNKYDELLPWPSLEKSDVPTDENPNIENGFQDKDTLHPGIGSARVLADQINTINTIATTQNSRNENSLNHKKLSTDRSRYTDLHHEHNQLSNDYSGSHISLVATGLLDKEKHTVALLAKLFKAKFAREINRTTTHVIVKADENNLAECTVKYFQGIAAGLWLVNFQWVLECISWNKLIPVEPYEIRGSTNSNIRRNELGSPHRSRLARLSKKPRLFDGHSFCCWGQFYSIAKGQLKRILEFAGAKVFEESDATSDKLKDLIIVCDPDNSSNDFYELRETFLTPPLSIDWILDSISSYEVQPRDRYYLCDVSSSQFDNHHAPVYSEDTSLF